MSATQYLQSLAAEDCRVGTHGVFADALVGGTRSQEKMLGYQQQDYLFVEGLVRFFASALAHALTLAGAVPATHFSGLICGPENTYFLRSSEALEVKSTVELEPQTHAFQAQMDYARHSGRYEMMPSILMIAVGIYLGWTMPFEDYQDDLPFWFCDWITPHMGEGFKQVVAYFICQFDIIWGTLNKTAGGEVTAICMRGVCLERALVDASWAGFTVAK